MFCIFCGRGIKKKDPHHKVKVSRGASVLAGDGIKKGAVCDKCYDIYLKQNRQMSIETAVYQEGRNVG